MLYAEGTQDFTDQVFACKFKIKVVDSSQVPTEEQTIVRLKEGIKFAYPLNYRILKMSTGKLSLEKVLEKINFFTDANEIFATGHFVKKNNLVASFAARENYNRFEESQSQRHFNERVMSEHEPAWNTKDR